ncbi:MAG: hypothetical protein P4L27_06420 [Ignavibacteriaceae bacterium]|nr:hypothetical protein [Ignavibacteriaceae bacterium]
MVMLLGSLFKLHPYYTHISVAFLLTLSVLFYNKNLNYKWIVSLVLLLILSICFGNKNTLLFSIILFRILVVLQIFIALANEFFSKHSISLYFSVLLFYEITVILKLTAVAFNYSTGIYLFYFSLAFELLIGIFFVFCNRQNSPLFKLPFFTTGHNLPPS